MDNLTLEHLAPYLPHGVEIKTDDGIFKVVGWVDDIGVCLDTILYGANAIPEYKLILRPMSDLTKEIEHKGQKFTPMTALSKRFDMNVVEHCFIEQNAPTDYRWIKTFRYDVVQTLISWHFDVFGLIEKGLAIDYNTVKGGPNEI